MGSEPKLCFNCRERPQRRGGRNCLVCHAAYQREWIKKHPLNEEGRRKDIARSYANVYKQRGKLIPEPCEMCGSDEHVEMHHEDYTRPLDVRWLCRACHRAGHAAGELEPEPLIVDPDDTTS